MVKNHNIITIDCAVKIETEKAYLIESDMGEAWVPKSQVEIEDGEIQIPEWLAIEKGII